MNLKLVFLLTLFAASSFIIHARINPLNVKASNGLPVHNLNTGLNYATIQDAISASETKDGHTILVDAGTYYEHIVANKSLSIIGQNSTNPTLNGNGTGTVIYITAPHTTVKQFTVTNGTIGIKLYHSDDSMILENDLNHNTDGAQILYSDNVTISENIIANNTGRGAIITTSTNFKATRNYVSHNGWATHNYGINANDSSNGLIMQNKAYDNYYDGIGLLNSRNCAVIENDVRDNQFLGIYLDSSDDNRIYHNNIINNRGKQATAATSMSTWDDGYPSGGNYWSDYTGSDANHDGIGGTPYFVDVNNNTDRYPLMGTFTGFDTSLGYDVNVVSNSTINSLNYIETNPTIKMTVSNASSAQTFGFCRVCIPKNLIAPPYTVTIDEGSTTVINFNGTLYDNTTHRWIYFAYQHSTHEVDIIPELPRTLMFSLAIMTSMLGIVIGKRKRLLDK